MKITKTFYRLSTCNLNPLQRVTWIVLNLQSRKNNWLAPQSVISKHKNTTSRVQIHRKYKWLSNRHVTNSPLRVFIHRRRRHRVNNPKSSGKRWNPPPRYGIAKRLRSASLFWACSPECRSYLCKKSSRYRG